VIRSLPRGFTRRKIFPGLIYRNFFHFGESDFAHNTKKVMTQQSPNAAPQEFKDIVQLACLEVWGGNRRVNHTVELPGLAGWIYSEPVAKAALGGDVHYISVCSNGIISRFALADVSGHGRSSSVMAQLLPKLIHKHSIGGTSRNSCPDLNESLRNTKKSGEQYATAALFAYCRPTRELVFTKPGIRQHSGTTPRPTPGTGSNPQLRRAVRRGGTARIDSGHRLCSGGAARSE